MGQAVSIAGAKGYGVCEPLTLVQPHIPPDVSLRAWSRVFATFGGLTKTPSLSCMQRLYERLMALDPATAFENKGCIFAGSGCMVRCCASRCRCCCVVAAVTATAERVRVAADSFQVEANQRRRQGASWRGTLSLRGCACRGADVLRVCVSGLSCTPEAAGAASA